MNARAKAKDLVELATAEGTDEKERVVAALQAVGLIRKYRLLDSSIDELLGGVGETLRDERETIAAASKVVSALTSPDLVDAIKSLGKRFKTARSSTRERRRRR